MLYNPYNAVMYDAVMHGAVLSIAPTGPGRGDDVLSMLGTPERCYGFVTYRVYRKYLRFGHVSSIKVDRGQSILSRSVSDAARIARMAQFPTAFPHQQ